MSEPADSVFTTEHNVTRRNFFHMAVGSLVVLPAVVGSSLIDTKTAYAEESNGEYHRETNGGAFETPTTELIAVRGSEVVVIVADAATGGSDPVPGARVRITSHYNEKSVDGATGEEGLVRLDISNLAENPNNVSVNDLTKYAFNGTLSVTCSDYREFETALIRVTGGCGIRVATRELPEFENDPYPRKVAFDGWDILYHADNKFIATPQNDVDHELSFEFRRIPSNSAVTMRLKDRETGEVLQSKNARPSGGTLKASFTKKFLKYGDVDALEPGTQFDIEIEQGDFICRCPIKLSIEEGVVDNSEHYVNYAVKPIDVTLASSKSDQSKWPRNMPLLGGDDMKGFSPDLYYEAWLHPMGYFQLAPKTGLFGYVLDSDDKDVFKDQGWSTQTLRFANQWWVKGRKEMEGGASRTRQGWAYWENTWPSGKSSGVIVPIEGFGPIKVLANLQLAAIAQWDVEKRMFQGTGAGQLFVTTITCLTSDFWLGPVPVPIAFDFNTSTVRSLNAGFYTDPEPKTNAASVSADSRTWKWDYSDTGMTFTLNLVPCLSVGVGIGGIGSVSSRGRFQTTTVFSVASQRDQDSDTDGSGHIIAGYAAQISLVISMFFFVSSFNLKNHPYSVWFDSWEHDKGTNDVLSTADEADGDWRRTFPGLTMAGIVNELKIIDDATMSRTNEFNGTSPSDQAREEEEVFDWDTARKEDRTINLDDGTPITYAVYSLKCLTEADEEDNQEGQGPLEGQSESEEQANALPVKEAQDAVIPDKQAVEAPATDAIATDNGSAAAAAAAAIVLDAMAEVGAGENGGDVATAQPVDELQVEQLPAEGLPSEEQLAEDAAGAASTQDALEEPKEADGSEEEQKVMLHRRPSSIEYEPVSAGTVPPTMVEGASPRSATPKVSDISRHGGIILHPDTDKIIAGNSSGDSEVTPYVFGDPHVKVAIISTTIDGTYLRATCSFRIGVVTINGKTRTRIIMTVIDAQNGEGTTDAAVKRYIGYSKPIDFEFIDLKGVSHADLYDYDYDIARTTIESQTGDIIDMVHLVVVSGMRSNGDSTSIADASTNLVFSYVNFSAAEALGNTTYLVRTVSADSVLGEGNHLDSQYHCISNVRIATDGTNESSNLLVGMLDRSSDLEDAVLTDNYGDGTGGTVKTSVIFALLDQLEEEWLVPSRKDVDDAMGISEIGNGTILGMSISPKIQGAYTVTLSSMTETYFFVVKLSEQYGAFTSIKKGSTFASNMRLVPWPQQNCFLTTFPSAEYVAELNESGNWNDPATWDRSKWMLQKAWWKEELGDQTNPESGTPILHFEPIGPDNFSIDTFGINSSGTFIYWPQGREGDDGLVYHEDGSSEVVDEGVTHLYRLMAARIHNGLFSDPFVLAEVDHNVSDLVIVPADDSVTPLEVLSVEHVQSGTDKEDNPVYLHHEANVWYTAVPHVACATVIDCYAPVPFTSVGNMLAFHVTVRNDGNCFLKGCTLQLCLHETTADKDGKPIASTSATPVKDSVARLAFSEETLVESHFNPRNEDSGELENIESDLTLAPGKCSIYEVMIRIPDDWEKGNAYVSMVASVSKDEDVAGDVAEDGSLSAMSEDIGVCQEFAVEPGEYQPYIQRSAPDVNKNRTYMDVLTVVMDVEDDNMADAPMAYGDSDSFDSDPNSPDSGEESGNHSGQNSGKNSGKSSGKSSGTKSGSKGKSSSSATKLPKTGDLSTGIIKGLAATGAALTAFGIYSAQKENEQERQ